MAVYVDDAKIPYGRMIMCHMIADSEDELHKMADTIGINRRWHQYPGSYKSHYDISLSKRHIALENGAIEITRKYLALHIKEKRQQYNQDYQK